MLCSVLFCSVQNSSSKWLDYLVWATSLDFWKLHLHPELERDDFWVGWVRWHVLPKVTETLGIQGYSCSRAVENCTSSHGTPLPGSRNHTASTMKTPPLQTEARVDPQLLWHKMGRTPGWHINGQAHQPSKSFSSVLRVTSLHSVCNGEIFSSSAYYPSIHLSCQHIINCL